MCDDMQEMGSGSAHPLAAEGESSGTVSEQVSTPSTSMSDKSSRLRLKAESSSSSSHVPMLPDIFNGASAARLYFSEDMPESVHGLKFGHLLGYGTFAEVRHAKRQSDGVDFAVKVINKSDAPEEYTRKYVPRELEAARKLKHPHLIECLEVIETDRHILLIMELAVNGTLYDQILFHNHFTETKSRRYFRQLMSAVDFMHWCKMAHRDIKCENILLDKNMQLKLGDFGFVTNETRTTDQQVILSKTYCGSYAYASPELLHNWAYDPFLADIWACGIVLHAMLYGHLPFEEENVTALVKEMESVLTFPEKPPVSPDCKQLIRHILAPCEMRYNMSQVLLDPWFGAGKEDDLFTIKKKGVRPT